jgi:hypothetical protein
MPHLQSLADPADIRFLKEAQAFFGFKNELVLSTDKIFFQRLCAETPAQRDAQIQIAQCSHIRP